ncbi:DUF1659 domain-containing protein [Anaerosalibacter bizertensis]|uniref:DUF1659 domain-containing protein n=1 Tax=Anaerosalibacter bizertensis TaxID=932217 RepID=A0A844FH67_9FIRM|nr:DUF1659 domain-containing protein [Anaerosalibacter bizertensis]MSS43306.1 DUF1659 domain-containing protein [Anaerosalibacter bizertensis]
MAVTEIKDSAKLKLELDGGMDGDKQIVKSKTYSKLKVDAANENVYGVAKSLSGLQELPLLKVKKVEEVELLEEI